MIYRYFYELKNRFILFLFEILIVVVFCFIYKENLVYLAILPFSEKLLIKYVVFTELSQAFEIYLYTIKFVLYNIIFVSSLYHVFLFLSPGFNNLEYSKAKKLVTAALNYLIIVNCFFHFLMFPAIWQIFGFIINNLSNYFIFYFEPHIIDILNFFKNFYILYLFTLSCALTFNYYWFHLKNESFQEIKNSRNFLYVTISFLLVFGLPIELAISFLLLILFSFYFEIKTLFQSLINVRSILIRQNIKTN